MSKTLLEKIEDVTKGKAEDEVEKISLGDGEADVEDEKDLAKNSKSKVATESKMKKEMDGDDEDEGKTSDDDATDADDDDGDVEEGKKKMKEGDNKNLDAGNEGAASIQKGQAKAGSGDKGEKLKESMEELFSEYQLSEGFTGKASALFEGAIAEAVVAHKAQLDEEYETKLNESVADLEEKLDQFLDFVVENWMKENKLAIEAGLRTEITESFMNGLQKLFEENYIEVPEEKYDLVEDLETKNADLTNDLNQAIAENLDLKREGQKRERDDVVSKLTEGLTDVQAAKFSTLAEEISFETAELFESKLKTIHENHFKAKAQASKEEGVGSPAENLAEGRMGDYVGSISKMAKK